jgi:hypothetical protein
MRTVSQSGLGDWFNNYGLSLSNLPEPDDPSQAASSSDSKKKRQPMMRTPFRSNTTPHTPASSHRRTAQTARKGPSLQDAPIHTLFPDDQWVYPQTGEYLSATSPKYNPHMIHVAPQPLVQEITNLISAISDCNAIKSNSFLSFLRENGNCLNAKIIPPSASGSPELGAWPPEQAIEEPILFSVGSVVVEDFIGSGPCSKCAASSSARCEPQLLFDPAVAVGGLYTIAGLLDNAHFSENVDLSTIGELKYSSSKSAQLDTPTENGRVHQVSKEI